MAEKTAEELAAEEAAAKENFITKDQVVDMVNKAVSTHLGRQLDKTIAPMAEQLNQLIESQTALAAAQAASKPADDKPGDPPNTKTGEWAHKRITEMEGQVEKAKSLIADYQKKVDEAESKRQAAEDAAKTTGMVNELKTSLKKNGVPDGLIDAAVAQLHHAQNRVSYNDEGQITFTVKGDFGDETVTLDKGVESWAQAEGKVFLPAKGTQGAGQGPAKRVVTPSKETDGPMNDDELGSGLLEHFLSANAGNQG